LVCTFELDDTRFIEPLRNKVINLSGTTLNCLQDVFTAFINTAHDDLSKDALQALLLTMLIRLKQDESAGAEAFTVIKDNLVSKVNKVLIESKKHELSVPYVADQLGLSESRTRSLFKTSSGVSLGQYILNYKIHISLSLLAENHLSIADIADEAGFSSLQSYSRAFKQQSGQTPSEFRNASIAVS